MRALALFLALLMQEQTAGAVLPIPTERTPL
jgi:hypothetical protein